VETHQYLGIPCTDTKTVTLTRQAVTWTNSQKNFLELKEQGIALLILEWGLLRMGNVTEFVLGQV